MAASESWSSAHREVAGQLRRRPGVHLRRPPLRPWNSCSSFPVGIPECHTIPVSRRRHREARPGWQCPGAVPMDQSRALDPLAPARATRPRGRRILSEVPPGAGDQGPAAPDRSGDRGYGQRVRLIDRRPEKQALDSLLDRVRAGMSGALVLRGEPGVGKSALLNHAVDRAADLQVVRMVAAEPEVRLGFAAVHQLLVPFRQSLDWLPGPQRQALGVAFGLVSGPPADPFLVGLAVLTLLSDTAQDRPVLCVIDDAQWLDDESADVLGIVARRLLADRVGMLFAIRETTEPDPHLQALPGLQLTGLPEPDAYELLATAAGRPIE